MQKLVIFLFVHVLFSYHDVWSSDKKSSDFWILGSSIHNHAAAFPNEGKGQYIRHDDDWIRTPIFTREITEEGEEDVLLWAGLEDVQSDEEEPVAEEIPININSIMPCDFENAQKDIAKSKADPK